MPGNARVPHQQRNQNHANEWDESTSYHNGIEGVLGRGLPRIGEASDQFEAMMVSIPAAVPLRPLTELTESLNPPSPSHL